MCQRKITYKDQEHVVPLMNGCKCPMIKEFRHIGVDIISSIPEEVFEKRNLPRKEYCLPEGCFDMHSSIPIVDAPGHHVVFRQCVCFHPSGLCMKLPPLLYQPENNVEVYDEYDEDDEDDNSCGGNMGIRPMP